MSLGRRGPAAERLARGKASIQWRSGVVSGEYAADGERIRVGARWVSEAWEGRRRRHVVGAVDTTSTRQRDNKRVGFTFSRVSPFPRLTHTTSLHPCV